MISWFILLAFVAAVCAKIHSIPQLNGSFVQMTDSEVADEIRKIQMQSKMLFGYNARKHVRYFSHYISRESGKKVKEELKVDDARLLFRSSFNPFLPTKVLVHGWNAGDPPIDVPANAFLKHFQKCNVIEVDWREGSNTNYITARTRDASTGQAVADFIKFLVASGGASLDDFELIGFSLGAHVAGFAGNSLGGQVPVIVALEPAGPLYDINSRNRLERSDAKFVEVIHLFTGWGMNEPIGHVDFYANSGWSQPGCGIDLFGSCSHSRAWQYFAESINSDVGFWGRKCRDSLDFATCKRTEGARRKFGARPVNESSLAGIYYFETSSKEPFARGYV